MKARTSGNVLRLTGWLLAGALLVGTGCSIVPEASSDPTRYYVLTGPGHSEDGATRVRGTLRLGLKAVELSPYLRKGTMVVRKGRNELVYNDYARWAETLEAGISRAARAQLLASPAVDRVFAYPFPFDQERHYDIALNVIRCEGVKGGDGGTVARFAAVVEITTAGEGGGEVVSRKVFRAPDVPWDGKDYGALAEALSASVGALCEDLVASLPEKK